MKILVKVKPNAKKESIERVSQQTLGLDISDSSFVEYKVSVKEPPVAGKANEAVRRVLAEYFDVSKSNIFLVSGSISKKKIFEINGK